MTLLEKIKNYKWFDSPNKLRVILEELYNSIGGGSGGGNQDLQSVLTTGGTASMNAGARYVNLFGADNPEAANIYSFTNVDDRSGAGINIAPFGLNMFHEIAYNVQASIGLYNGDIRFEQILGNNSTRVEFTPPAFLGIAQINFPTKPTGAYILATLDDIKKIDLTNRIYENNSAAISGGLTANDVYRTSTGELRIVV